MSAVAPPAIEAVGVVKSFGRTRALDGLDLQVGTGEFHGFLGPNGAGKTTTLRLLLGLISRDAGEVRLLGADPWRDAVELHHRLAYVPGEVTLWDNLTGGEVIDLLTTLRGSLVETWRDELLERFSLDPSKRCRSYSKGNRQKVALVAALASDVGLLLLDEPTAGLDPLMEAEFQEVLRERRSERGLTVLLSSHILAEVEKLCDRVTIIRAGRAVETGSLDELRHLQRIAISARTVAPVESLDGLEGVHDLHRDGTAVSCHVDADALAEVHKRLAEAGIVTLTSAPPTLEEMFLRHYADDVVAADLAPGDDTP